MKTVLIKTGIADTVYIIGSLGISKKQNYTVRRSSLKYPAHHSTFLFRDMQKSYFSLYDSCMACTLLVEGFTCIYIPETNKITRYGRM
jgi:hypothetical protein